MTRVADLATMDRSALAVLWADLIGGDVPRQMSQPMQRRFLAHALQVWAHGDLAPALAARLDRIAAGTARKATPGLKPGARLLRAWNGVTHVVEVEVEGLRWNGTRHRSLSAIARAITGARWSGPRFFGLTGAEPADTGKVQRGAGNDRLRADQAGRLPVPGGGVCAVAGGTTGRPALPDTGRKRCRA